MAFDCLLMTGVVFVCGGTLFSIIASSTVYWKWVTDDDADLFMYTGLYTICYDQKEETECESIEEPRGYVYGTRSCVSTAFILGVIAVVLCFVHVYKVSMRTASKAMATLIAVLCFIAVAFLITANSVYGSFHDEDDKYEGEWDLGTSFYLAIVAIIGFIVGGILVWKSYNPDQVRPQAAIIIQNTGYPVAQPVYGAPGQMVMPPPYAQNGTQPQLYTTATSGQPMPPAYGQPAPPQPFATAAASAYGQPGTGQNFNTQYGNKDGQPRQDPSYPPPPPAQY